MTTIELRVHGVHGTPPDAMLGVPRPAQVAGDDEARFFRPGGSTTGDTEVEAFHWGSLTSGAAGRALWLLFLPFTLLNLARYTLLTWDDALVGPGGTGPGRSGWGRLADGLLRVTGLVMTLSAMLSVVYIAAGLLAAQCLRSAECVEQNSWLSFAGQWPWGAQLLLAAAPAAAVLGVIAWLGRRPSTYGKPARTHWMHDRKFGERSFWTEVAEVSRLRCCHVAGAAALVGLLFSGFLSKSQAGAAAWIAAPVVLGLMVLGAGLLVVTVLVTGTLAWPVSSAVASSLRWTGLGYAVVAVGTAVAAMWPVPGRQPGPLPRLSGLEATSNGLAVASVLLVLLTAGVTWRLAVLFAKREPSGPDATARPVAFSPMWNGHASTVAVTLAFGMLLAACGGITFHVADLVGQPALEGGNVVESAGDTQAPIFLSTSYWTGAWLLGAALVLVVGLVLPTAALLLQRVWSAVWFSTAAVAAWVLVFALATVERPFGGVAGAWPAGVLIAVGLALGALTWFGDAQVRALAENEVAGASGPSGDAGRPIPHDLVEELDRRRLRVARLWRRGQAKFRYSWAAALLAAVSALGMAAAGFISGWRLVVPGDREIAPAWLVALLTEDGTKDTTSLLAVLGVWASTALVVVLLGLGYRAFRQPSARTAIGVLWDLMSFWPRLVHPLCPPPYGGRAVLEVSERVMWLVNEKRHQRVVLSGHSQGSLICLAAATYLTSPIEADGGQRDLDETDRVQAKAALGLLTYGSQLQWAFARLFPCFVGFHHQARLYQELQGRWRSLYRNTDPLGGPVLSWSSTAPSRDPAHAGGGTYGHLLTDRCPGASSATHDVCLVDPVSLTRTHDDPEPRVAGHSGYYDDPWLARQRDEVFGPEPGRARQEEAEDAAGTEQDGVPERPGAEVIPVAPVSRPAVEDWHHVGRWVEVWIAVHRQGNTCARSSPRNGQEPRPR
ncbi:hypothetical protein PHK61_26520 [Actinomycetospora lutea]|uniref:hypothetical protein n=1 Tax=Actinomycetospora lutea TaxID=663604 RepID=UPI00236661EA|nr:hypothetical protein [Actinomycetospora lutea]MDD7941975.1 hypothetical protein [Actinomycetospora lutea]